MQSLIVIPFLALLVWSLLMQRRAVLRQQQAMEVQREAAARQQAAMAQVEESLGLSRASVRNQERVIVLLEEIRDRLGGER
jgi:heme exporter protein D